MININIPFRNANSINTVATATDLPATNNLDGDQYFVEDSQTLRVWSNGAWSAITLDFPYWQKVSLTYADFSTAGNLSSFNIATVAPLGVIHDVIIRVTESFGGGTIDGYEIGVGKEDALTYYADFNGMADPSEPVLIASVLPSVQSYTDTTHIKVAALSSGDTLDNATSGAFDIWFSSTTLP